MLNQDSRARISPNVDLVPATCSNLVVGNTRVRNFRGWEALTSPHTRQEFFGRRTRFKRPKSRRHQLPPETWIFRY
jgi:hypothetical protein